MSRYMRRPAHIFGGFGMLAGILGFCILAWLSFDKLIWGSAISGRPLFFLGILLTLLGVQIGSLGLIAEMINRRKSTNPVTYTNRQTMILNRQWFGKHESRTISSL